MGYKGENDGGKGKNRACGKAYREIPTEDYKAIVGENRCNNINFRPLSAYYLPLNG